VLVCLRECRAPGSRVHLSEASACPVSNAPCLNRGRPGSLYSTVEYEWAVNVIHNNKIQNFCLPPPHTQIPLGRVRAFQHSPPPPQIMTVNGIDTSRVFSTVLKSSSLV